MNSSYKFILWHEPHRVPTSPPPRAPVHAMNNVTIVHVSKTKSWLLLLAKTRPCSTNSSVDNVLHCKNEFLGLHYLMRFFFLRLLFISWALKAADVLRLDIILADGRKPGSALMESFCQLRASRQERQDATESIGLSALAVSIFIAMHINRFLFVTLRN